MDYIEAVAYLEAHTNLGVKPGLERIEWLMEAMGRPDQCAPVVHITGTNGKTTTARLVARILESIGVRTGAYTSPHLQRVNERISVDGEALDDEAFAAAFDDVLPFLALLEDETGESATYFEMTTAMGFAAFAEAPVSAQVLEVGLGGRWDASNVAHGDVAVITNVAVDHAEYLGSDPIGIAREKAGIIKAGSRVVIGNVSPEISDAIRARAAEAGADEVVEAGRDFELEGRGLAHGGQLIDVRGLYANYGDLLLPLFGSYQAQNAAVAIAAAESLAGGELDREAIEVALAAVTSPGRLEVVGRSPLLILDCAHNPAGTLAMAEAVSESFSYDRMFVVSGISADKDAQAMFEALAPLEPHVIATEYAGERSMEASRVAASAIEAGIAQVGTAEGLADAVAMATEMAGVNDLVLITGSIYTVGEARSHLVGPASAG